MGSCSGEQHNTKGLDGTFGSLVWVRRGNGSWWPGQIVDADGMNGRLDAQKSSGVPIKLLSRDDVDVEWYNLENTTKVKAFRCGDHDSCIEKAKAFAADPLKKRGKKAQRENAIILALELESALISKDCNNNDSALELSHSGLSFEEANAAAAALPNNNHPTTTAKRLRTPNDSEDDGNEGLKKRMKGLDDLGVGSNVKEPNGLVTESVPQCLNSLDLCGSDRPPTQLVANGSKGGSMPSFKKRRSKMVFHEVIKKKSRRRTLKKVFQKNELVTVPIAFDEHPTLPNNASEDPFDVGPSSKEKDDDPSIHRGPADITCSDAPLRENSPAEAGTPEKEELELPGSANSPTVQLSCLAQMIEKDWQTKGKRESRHPYRNLGPNTDPWRRPRYFFLPRCMFPEPVLYDVHVEVNAAYRPQHVPYISLMSKLDGKPVTGHPIAVEVLEEGGSDFTADLPGLYTTSGSSELEDDRKPETPIRPPKKLARKKKPGSSMKKPGSSMKKTRTLSSLTRSHRKAREERRLVVEKVRTPVLACIPLKVVFSRINEALNK